MSKKKAFTLAEILMVLGLLGVIAVITIPYLLMEFNKDKWSVTYKRTFAETFNVLGNIALENDCVKSLTCTHIFDEGPVISTKNFGNAMVRNMAVAQNCATSSGTCFSHKVKTGLAGSREEDLYETMNDKITFDKALFQNDGKGFYTFRTTRGVSYAVYSFGTQCLNLSENDPVRQAYINAYVTGGVAHADSESQMLSLCGFIIVDVNGDQRPNIWGRDVFGMWVTDKSVLGVYPFGGDQDGAFGGKCFYATQTEQDTRGCAAQLIKDGWKMKY